MRLHHIPGSAGAGSRTFFSFFFFFQENELGSSLLVAKIAEEQAVSCKNVNEIL